MVVLIADWALRFSIHSDSDRDNRVGAILLVVGFVLALLSPIIAELIKLSISRRREFLADATAAKITRFPEGLARALEKIAKDKIQDLNTTRLDSAMRIVEGVARSMGIEVENV